ncbi:MAG: RNA-binding protein [Candidatus Shapirobacteria bacterium]|nr:RNA-binding protein [Candidatus Shapirobacteria bacterium]
MSNNTPQKRLFIGSIPYKTTEGELLSLFITEGKVISVQIIKNRWGRSRGMGYVEYENLDDAIRAKEKYHHTRIGDLNIIVDYAQPDPYLTEEGRLRHEEAVQKRYKKTKHKSSFSSESGLAQNPDRPKEDYKPRFGFNKEKSSGDKKNKPVDKNFSAKHVRQTVYVTRHFGSKIGAKFASKTRFKKKK